MTPPLPDSRRRTKGDNLLLAEALLLMGLVRLAVKVAPFRLVMRWAGVYQAESPEAIDTELLDERERIAWAIDLVRLFTPWDSNCLAQAVAGSIMLRRRRVPGTVYLGVAKEKPGALVAHAWLRSGDRIIAGEPGHDRYAVVGTFANILESNG